MCIYTIFASHNSGTFRICTSKSLNRAKGSSYMAAITFLWLQQITLLILLRQRKCISIDLVAVEQHIIIKSFILYLL